MTSKFSLIREMYSPQRVVAAFVFLPLLAYTFPPFLAADLPFAFCLLFWLGVMMLALSATWLARALLRRTPSLSEFRAQDFVFATLILVLFTPALWLLAWVLFTCGGKMAPGLQAVTVYGVLFATGLMLVRRADPVSPEEDTPTARPRLLNRLPASFSGQVYRLAVRDHNVDVITSEGVFTIRSRFTDAIAEMEPVRGHCTHRSHWVVDSAVAATEKADGKTFLRLGNGDLVPVSRKYKPKLEDDGLICS